MVGADGGLGPAQIRQQRMSKQVVVKNVIKRYYIQPPMKETYRFGKVYPVPKKAFEKVKR